MMDKLLRLLNKAEENETANPGKTAPAGALEKHFPKLILKDFPATKSILTHWISIDLQYSGAITAFIENCELESGKSRPSEKWLKTCEIELIDVPEEPLVECFCNLLQAIAADFKTLHKTEHSVQYLYRLHIPQWFCGACWYAGYYLGHHAEIRSALDQLALISLKKVPGVGPLGAKVGNACLRAFAYMPGMEGISALFKHKNKATNRNVIKLTDTLLNEAAERQRMTRNDLEDLSAATFGLDSNQSRTEEFGDYLATLLIRNQSEVILEWRHASGKTLKSAPSVVKEYYKVELKQLQIAHKELKDVLSTQSRRIENAYVQQRSWRFADFTNRYVEHPVLHTLATRLIWQFEEGDRQSSGILHEGKWQDCQGASLDWLSPASTVQLWHPISSEPETVLRWRDQLMQLNITQPFKQAYREIYVVTPPEVRTSSYSNRFAAHVIRQHQFAAIAVQRGWQYTLQGQWDSRNIPHRMLPNWEYRIEFWVDSVTDHAPVSDTGVFVYIHTDQVRFYHKGQLVNMPDVPPLLFSEMMRDVDLFVGVCSIGNDPEWQDSGDNPFNNYWRSYAFAEELAESGKMRRAALERLIPRLKIGPQCSFSDKYLVVKGKRHTYKIHCGSGNILMSPNDKYLCIVPDASAKESSVYLPFEGDRMLSIIISKAMQLAADDKITDPTILLQL